MTEKSEKSGPNIDDAVLTLEGESSSIESINTAEILDFLQRNSDTVIILENTRQAVDLVASFSNAVKSFTPTNEELENLHAGRLIPSLSKRIQVLLRSYRLSKKG